MPERSVVAGMLLIAAAVMVAAHPASAKRARKAKPNPVLCEMLGMSNEYINRYDLARGKLRSRFVEAFSSDEEPAARYYAKLIRRLEKSTGTRFCAPLRVDDYGNYSFESERLAKRINRYYFEVEKNFATLSPALILGASKRCRLRFIRGAYRRYGKQGTNVIAISHGPYKAKTVGKVLLSLGAKNVALLHTSGPCRDQVFFDPGPRLSAALPIVRRITQTHFANQPRATDYHKLKH